MHVVCRPVRCGAIFGVRRATDWRSASRFPLFGIDRSGLRCPVLLPVVISEPYRAGGVFGRCRCSVECALTRPRSVWSGCDATDWRTTGRRPAQTDSQESARPLRRHVRPVLKHGPRSLTCERAIEIVESQTRNESEVYLYTSGDPYTSVYGAPAGHAIGWLAFRSTAEAWT